MQEYKLVLLKHPEITLNTRKVNPLVIQDAPDITDEDKELLFESEAELNILIQAQMMIEFQQDLKFKDPAYQLGVLAELFQKIGNYRMYKACMEADIKRIEKYTSTQKFWEMLMRHTKIITE